MIPSRTATRRAHVGMPSSAAWSTSVLGFTLYAAGLRPGDSSRNIATLLGLADRAAGYLLQGYFDAAHAHAVPGGDLVRRRHAGSIHRARDAAAAWREADAVATAARSRPVRGFMSGMGPTAFLDMPFRFPHLLFMFLLDRLTAFRTLAMAMTLLTGSLSRGAAGQRWITARSAGAGGCDAAQCRGDRALGMTDPFRRALFADQ